MTAPLIPADVTIPRLPWVPVYADRLWESDFFAVATDAEFRAAFCLWLKCWNQKPPGSLPSDDRQLCRLAELNGNLAKWRKVKRIALRHWIECDDGRLYHPVVSEIILETAVKLAGNRKRTAAATSSRWKGSNEGIRNGVRNGDENAPKIIRNGPLQDIDRTRISNKPKTNKPRAPAREGNGSAGEHLANGSAGEEDFLIEGWNPVGRFAPLAAQAPPSPGALKSRRKELLRQKLMRFVHATMRDADRTKAIAGLSGGDTERSDQWWLDTLDVKMRAAHWDDVGEGGK